MEGSSQGPKVRPGEAARCVILQPELFTTLLGCISERAFHNLLDLWVEKKKRNCTAEMIYQFRKEYRRWVGG